MDNLERYIKGRQKEYRLGSDEDDPFSCSSVSDAYNQNETPISESLYGTLLEDFYSDILLLRDECFDYDDSDIFPVYHGKWPRRPDVSSAQIAAELIEKCEKSKSRNRYMNNLNYRNKKALSEDKALMRPKGRTD